MPHTTRQGWRCRTTESTFWGRVRFWCWRLELLFRWLPCLAKESKRKRRLRHGLALWVGLTNDSGYGEHVIPCERCGRVWSGIFPASLVVGGEGKGEGVGWVGNPDLETWTQVPVEFRSWWWFGNPRNASLSSRFLIEWSDGKAMYDPYQLFICYSYDFKCRTFCWFCTT